MRALARRAISAIAHPSALHASLLALDRHFDSVRKDQRHPLQTAVVVPTRPRTGRRRRADPWVHPFLDDPALLRTPKELRGRALDVLKDSNPTIYGYPKVEDFRVAEPFYVWGRPWVVLPSTMGAHVGLGLFSLSDIIVREGCPPTEYPELFPFYGPRYSAAAWRILTRQCPTFSRYGIAIKGDPRFSQIDGYPGRTGNLAGYINSTTRSRRHGFRPNAEWVEYIGQVHPRLPSRITQFVITHAIISIRAGDEIFVDYDWH